LSVAFAANVSRTVVRRELREKSIRKHSSVLKSALTETHHEKRLSHCLSFIDYERSTFVDMSNIIHVDEKWFYMDKVKRKVILCHDEEEPHRVTKNKGHIRKVMFLCAVTKPCFDAHKKMPFDGKIGIWPFISDRVVQRSSAYHKRGDVVMEPILSIDRDIYRSFILEKVLPAIKEKVPRRHSTLFIQQDNAGAHILRDDPAFKEVVAQLGREVILINQPPQSPDLNILDLGYFNSIQSLQQKNASNTYPELVQAVQDSFQQLPIQALTNVFITLQLVMEHIILDNGGNNYKLPHINKNKLRKEGRLTEILTLRPEVEEKIQEIRMNI